VTINQGEPGTPCIIADYSRTAVFLMIATNNDTPDNGTTPLRAR